MNFIEVGIDLSTSECYIFRVLLLQLHSCNEIAVNFIIIVTESDSDRVYPPHLLIQTISSISHAAGPNTISR